MAQFTRNNRIDPYKNFKFRVYWAGISTPVAGVSKISELKRTTEVVSHREGNDISTPRHSPGSTKYEPITLERGVTHDPDFEEWANLVYSTKGNATVSLARFRRDVKIELLNLQGVVEQFKIAAAVATSARIVFNTSFGLLGLIDVASEMDLYKHNEDFGQTLAVWGVPSGPYLVLPIIGPMTIRDTAGLAVDWTYFDPIFDRQTLRASLATLTIKYIDIRAGLLKASNILDETVPDKYSFVRDAYQLRREFLIYDGQPPEEFSEDELFDDEDLFKDEELFNDELTGDELLQEEGMKSQMEIMDIETTPATDPAAGE